jgi:methylmalonyl-CoA/ethylmalonyl-CoA epimerase
MESTTQEAFIGSVEQIALVTADLDRTMEALTKVGVGPFTVYKQDASNADDLRFRGDESGYTIRFALTEVNGLAWEVIQPLTGSNTYTEFLEKGGSGLHHVAVDCGGIPYEDRISGLEERGYTMVQSGSAFSGAVRFAYFEGEDPGEPLIEIFDFPEDFDLEVHAEGTYPPAAG